MGFLVGRRRVEQFASAVDGRAPVEQLPAELRELVDMVGTVRRLDAPAPRPDFSASLRERLMAEAETALAPASPLVLPPRRRGASERRLTAAAAVFTLVGGGAGMALAAQEAVPGDPLYPIKRGIEDAQLSMQSDPDDRGRTYLEQAQDRLEEAGRLVDDEASSAVVADTVDSFVVQAVAGADLLLGSFEDDRAPEDVAVLRTFAAESLERLQALAESAPADIQDELARAAVVLQRIDQQAAATCENCSELPSLEMPVLMAQAAEISRAMDALRTQEINNDHPALAVKLPGARPRSDSGPTAATPGAGADTQQPGDGAPRLPVDSPGDLPTDPVQALKDVDRATGGLLGQVGTDTGDTTKKLTEDLEDTVDGTLDQDLLD